MIKNIITFILIYLSWFIGSFLFPYNKEFYDMLSLPSFTLKPIFISISWIIIYFLITYSIYKVKKKTNILSNHDYLYILITSYLANQLFPFMFFYLRSPFFGFVMTSIVFISSIFLLIETKKIINKTSYILIPYIVYSFYALILSISILVMNS